MGKSMAQFGVGAVAALVLLRLAVGWHFCCEGMKKLEPGFSSAGFLRAATGPLAPLYHSLLPNPYGFNERLATPLQTNALTAEQVQDRTAWEVDYAGRVKEARAAKQTPLVEFPPHASYSNWAEAIAEGWRKKRDRAAAIAGGGEEAKQQAEETYRAHLQKLADYFAEEEGNLDVFRHELWRLKNLQSSPKAQGVAFQEQRILEKTAETSQTKQSFPADLAALEADYIASLTTLPGMPEQDSSAGSSLSSFSPLPWVDRAVTWTVLGVGGCLMLGFCTRIASVIGGLFLLSVMASQPPWVAGAQTTYFGYQLVEVAAFLVLATIGAGRWYGIDSVLSPLCSACCRSKLE